MKIRHVLAFAMVLGCSIDLLAVACRPSCPPKSLAEIEARYSLAVMHDCKGYGSLAECPSAPALKDARRKDEEAAKCR